MKIIFLDFDGVLNSLQYDRERRTDQGNIDKSRLVLLEGLVEQTNAKIVLTTTWRKHWNKDNSLCDAIGEEINTIFDKHGLHIYDKTSEIDVVDRAAEVRTWLQSHVNEVEEFVILDDIAFGWGELETHLVKTNYRIGRGLETIHIDKAKNILIKKVSANG